MGKLSIRDLNLSGKRVFIRADFNVPLENGQVADDTRIRATLPTLRLAIEQGGRLVVASHLGRPKGKPDSKLSLKPVAVRLKEILGRPVIFSSDCIGQEAQSRSQALKNGDLLLLENLRFHAEEAKNDEEFSRQLASLCDGIFVNDAFGAAHRAHASVVGITSFVEQAAAGLLMEQELSYLGKALTNPERPFLAILGGAKVSDKIEVIQNLMKIANAMLIGGAMSYTFFRARKFTTGKSLVEEDKTDLALALLGEAVERGCRFILPIDHVLARSPDDDQTQVAAVEATPADWMGLDIGPKTIELFQKEIAAARTIVWNGPVGMFEKSAFANGTVAIAHAVADATSAGATSIVGGGDTVAAVEQAGVAQKVSHISTGGGASLEFLAGEKLPGVEALTSREA